MIVETSLVQVLVDMIALATRNHKQQLPVAAEVAAGAIYPKF